jgi:hypothetical protein
LIGAAVFIANQLWLCGEKTNYTFAGVDRLTKVFYSELGKAPVNGSFLSRMSNPKPLGRTFLTEEAVEEAIKGGAHCGDPCYLTLIAQGPVIVITTPKKRPGQITSQ